MLSIDNTSEVGEYLLNATGAIFKSCVERGVIVRPVGSRIVISPPAYADDGGLRYYRFGVK